MKKTNIIILNIPGSVRQKIAFILVLALLLTFAITPRGYAQSNEAAQTYPYKQTFVISAYYSPLPNQSRYYRGNFESEVVLQGEGVHGADGTRVYSGMIAAPKTFPFGTKIEIPGLGVGTVHDRGGAIKGNRLDVWMGTGEEGLQRAFGWGMRTVEVTVHGPDAPIQENLNFSSVPLMELSWIGTPARSSYFLNDLTLGDEGEDVIQLQSFLQKLGFYSGNADGKYESTTIEAVTAFQLQEGVINSTTDIGSGNFGPKTRRFLEIKLLETKQEKLDELPKSMLEQGASGEEVKAVQSILKYLGHLQNITGNFDVQTKSAVIKFQIENGVVSSANDSGAGVVGPHTLTALKNYINVAYTPQNNKVNTALIASSAENILQGTPTPVMQNYESAFINELKRGDKNEEVTKLQQELIRLNFLGIKPTGFYGEVTEHAVFKFQQAFGLLRNKEDAGAGSVGPRTMAKLNTIVESRENNSIEIAKVKESKELVLERVISEREFFVGTTVAQGFSNDLASGSRGTDVERLQKILKRLGFFNSQFTSEYFGEITKKSIIAFQESHGIKPTGQVDIFTRRVINQILGLSS